MLSQYNSVQQLGQELKLQAQKSEDLLISSKRMRFQALPVENDEGKYELEPRIVFPELNQSYELSKYAHRSLASLSGVPSQYYHKLMQDKQLGLLEQNVNTLLKNVEPESVRMARTFKPSLPETHGELRNLMSDSYYRLDNYQVANTLLNALGDHLQSDNVEFKSLALTDELMHIKLIMKNLEADIRKDDPVQIGISVKNSDIGRSSLKIMPFVYRLVCTNGMIQKDNSYSRQHRTSKGNNSSSLLTEHQLSNETKSLQDQALISEVKDHINLFTTEGFMNQQVQKLRDAMSEEISKPEQTIKALGQAFNYSEALTKDIFHDLLQSNDFTKFGVVQSVTQQAHQSENVLDYNQSTALETDGFTMLNMDFSKLEVTA